MHDAGNSFFERCLESDLGISGQRIKRLFDQRALLARRDEIALRVAFEQWSQ